MAHPAPLSPLQVERLARFDCPTIANALELLDPGWDRVSGLMAPRIHAVFPDMPTVSTERADQDAMRDYLLDGVRAAVYLFGVERVIVENVPYRRAKGSTDSRQPAAILDDCIEVNRLENSGDQLRDFVISKLFDEATDPFFLIKWKEVFQGAETVA